MRSVQVNRPGRGDAGDSTRSSGAPKADLNRPVLITDAPVNLDDEWERRGKRYLITMLIRATCVLGAAATYTVSAWAAAAFVAGAVVLPWTAVVMANDRPPKEGVRFRRIIGRHQTQQPPYRQRAGREIDSAPHGKFGQGTPPTEETTIIEYE